MRGTHHEAVMLEDVHLAHRTGAVLEQPRVDAGLVEFMSGIEGWKVVRASVFVF